MVGAVVCIGSNASMGDEQGWDVAGAAGRAPLELPVPGMFPGKAPGTAPPRRRFVELRWWERGGPSGWVWGVLEGLLCPTKGLSPFSVLWAQLECGSRGLRDAVTAPRAPQAWASRFLSGLRQLFGESFAGSSHRSTKTAPGFQGGSAEAVSSGAEGSGSAASQPEEMVWCCPNIPSWEINLDWRSGGRNPNFGSKLDFSLTMTRFPWELPQPLPAELPQNCVFHPKLSPGQPLSTVCVVSPPQATGWTPGLPWPSLSCWITSLMRWVR